MPNSTLLVSEGSFSDSERDVLGHGPTVLTVPHSTLMRIHKLATEGQLQYQQLELDLFRMAALYIVEYMHEEFMGQASGLCLSSVRFFHALLRLIVNGLGFRRGGACVNGERNGR